jgi:hypothetical protein
LIKIGHQKQRHHVSLSFNKIVLFCYLQSSNSSFIYTKISSPESFSDRVGGSVYVRRKTTDLIPFWIVDRKRWWIPWLNAPPVICSSVPIGPWISRSVTCSIMTLGTFSLNFFFFNLQLSCFLFTRLLFLVWSIFF